MSTLTAQFTKKKILVIGDVMLDEYIEGSAERISPEAPIPVLLQKNVRHVFGGAGNVAANVAALTHLTKLLAVPQGYVLGWEAFHLDRVFAKVRVQP